MSPSIKRPMAVLGLAMVLSSSVFAQADTSAATLKGRRPRFTDISVTNNTDGTHQTYSVLAGDAGGNTYRMRKVDGRIVELEVNGKAVPRDQYARYDELLGHLEQPVPPVPPAAPVAPAAAPAAVAPPSSPLPPAPPAPPEPPRANKYISQIIDDLANKGIINDDSKLSFLLDNAEMTVNGVKQPDAVFQFFQQKYIKHAGDHFRYECQGSSAITNIKIDDDKH